MRLLLAKLLLQGIRRPVELNPRKITARYFQKICVEEECEVLQLSAWTMSQLNLTRPVLDSRSDRTTLRSFLEKIEKQYGKAKRIWVMDRGIPTEEVLEETRKPERQTYYLVGTAKGKIREYENKWLDLPWQQVRESVEVKLFE